MAYSVRILADSVNPRGVRLVTWELAYPRMVHAELLTHRVLSKCSASSRAIPVEKMLKRIEDDPVQPVWWGKNQAGMQAREALTGDALAAVMAEWLAARDSAVRHARRLSELGLHKQIANRPTETWMWIVVIASTTKTMNLFSLRDHEDAQPEFQHFAHIMNDMYWSTRPTFVPAGSWHMPMLPDRVQLVADGYDEESLRRIAISRCARASYMNHDGVRDPKEDAVGLFERLRGSRPMHLSPFEHIAQSCDDRAPYGNFHGWKQYRYLMPGEAGPPEPLWTPTGECVNYNVATRQPMEMM